MDEDFDKKLCLEVSRHQPLFNPAHIKYQSDDVCDVLWMEIAFVCNTSVSICKQRWEALAAEYTNIVQNACNNGRLPAGNAQFKLMDEMKFFTDYALYSESASSLGNSGDSSFTNQNTVRCSPRLAKRRYSTRPMDINLSLNDTKSSTSPSPVKRARRNSVRTAPKTTVPEIIEQLPPLQLSNEGKSVAKLGQNQQQVHQMVEQNQQREEDQQQQQKLVEQTQQQQQLPEFSANKKPKSSKKRSKAGTNTKQQKAKELKNLVSLSNTMAVKPTTTTTSPSKPVEQPTTNIRNPFVDIVKCLSSGNMNQRQRLNFQVKVLQCFSKRYIKTPNIALEKSKCQNSITHLMKCLIKNLAQELKNNCLRKQIGSSNQRKFIKPKSLPSKQSVVTVNTSISNNNQVNREFANANSARPQTTQDLAAVNFKIPTQLCNRQGAAAVCISNNQAVMNTNNTGSLIRPRPLEYLIKPSINSTIIQAQPNQTAMQRTSVTKLSRDPRISRYEDLDPVEQQLREIHGVSPVNNEIIAEKAIKSEIV